MKVYHAISKVMAQLAKDGIAKSSKNAQQGYSFRGIDHVYNALAPVLSTNGLVILPRVLSREVTERATAKGGVLFYVVVNVEFDLVCAEDGSKHTIATIGEAMDSADKATNKAMSAAYKYACIQAFCIPTEGDNDADATTHDVISEYQAVCERLQDEITEIKIGINKNDYKRAAEAWFSLTEEDKMLIWKAPSNGGCFTTQERAIMKTAEFREAMNKG